jgi:hypothetical protein
LLAVKKRFPVTNQNLAKDLEPVVTLLKKVLVEVGGTSQVGLGWVNKIIERLFSSGERS